MERVILDVYSERDHMVVWLRDVDPAGGATKVVEPFTPAFYVRAKEDQLRNLEKNAPLLPGVGRVERQDRLCALDEYASPVLQVEVPRHDQLYNLARTIDEMGEYYEHDLYDVDLRMSHRWFLAHGGLFPFARVRAWAPGRYTLRDDQWDIDFHTPELRISLLDVFNHDGKTPLRLDEKLGSITLDEATLTGSEDAILTQLCKEVQRRDPDILLTRGGDSLLFPYLEERRKAANIDMLRLGRDGTAPRVQRKARSFFTYGKIKHQPGPVAINGRIHIDLDASTFYAEGGLEAMVEQARLTSTPMQELSRLTTGTAFSTMQVDVAKRHGNRLIPYRKNYPEAPKNGHTYLLADRGAFAYDPQVGVYEDCH